MSMISRYQKSGGFIQLLKLVETSGKAKQENFLNIIEQEDPRWAAAIKQKMLSIEKIMHWGDNVQAEIFSRINELTLSTALHGFTPEHWTRLSKTFSPSQIRRIEDLKNARQPNAAEISAAYVKVLEDVRGMILDRFIKIDEIDPDLAVPENIEDRIAKNEINAPLHASTATTTTTTTTSSGGAGGASPATERPSMKIVENPADSAELRDTKQRLARMLTENEALKAEVKMLKERLGQIKKLSA